MIGAFYAFLLPGVACTPTLPNYPPPPPPSPTPFTHSMISGAFLKTYFVTDKIILSKANFVGLYFMWNVINFTILNHTHAIIWVLGQFVFIKWGEGVHL